MAVSIDLVPIRPEDLEFLYRVYASTREAELSQVPWTAEEKENFLRFQFQAQHSHYQQYFAGSRFDVIVQNGAPIGRLYVDRGKTVITIIDIALLPEYQRQGIGSQLIREILAEAEATGKAVQLHVEHYNPALQLYERFGFRHINDHGVYYQMEWTAPPAAAP